MAKKKHNEVAVGITVLIVLALTVYIVVTLADWSLLFAAQQEITVKIPYKTGLMGLTKGSPVQLGGVKIGSIANTGIFEPESIADSGQGPFVFFTLTLPTQYQLRTDCQLIPQSNVLGGQVMLSIQDLGQDGDIVTDGQVVDLQLTSTLMDALKSEFDPQDPNSFMARMKSEFTKENEDSVIAHLSSAIAKLDRDVSVISLLFQKALTRVDETLETTHAAMKRIKTIVQDERIDKTVGNITETSANLKQASAKLDTSIAVVSGLLQQTLRKVDSTLETTQAAIGRLKTIVNDERIDTIVDNITATSSTVSRATREIEQAPWKLIRKPSHKEQTLLALVSSAGSFASGAEALDRASLRLSRLMDEMNEGQEMDKARLTAVLGDLEESFNQFREAEKTFWEKLE